MNMKQIEKEVKKIKTDKEKNAAVGMLYELYELKEQTEKQLKTVKDKIISFKKNPTKFIEKNEDLWD